MCLNLSHSDIQREITLTVSIEEGDANGRVLQKTEIEPITTNSSFAEADFGPIDDTLDIVFTPNTGLQGCFLVNIIDDDILEDTEFFLLSILPTNDSAVVLDNTVLNVGIENDDSKQSHIFAEPCFSYQPISNHQM